MEYYEINKALINKHGISEQLKAMKREIDELLYELENPTSSQKVKTETADCLNTTAQMPLIALLLSEKYNFTMQELVEERKNKYKKAKKKYLKHSGVSK